jgi:hypothetical protein
MSLGTGVRQVNCWGWKDDMTRENEAICEDREKRSLEVEERILKNRDTEALGIF